MLQKKLMSAVSMIATHINAPYGPVVTPNDVEVSLRRGVFCAATDEANALLSALFVECSRSLIERAANELDVPMERIFMLYQDSLQMGLPEHPEWSSR